MKKMKKAGIILIIFIVITLSFTNSVKAAKNDVENTISFDKATNEANDFVGNGQYLAEQVVKNADLIRDLIPIAQALRTIGIGVILCVGVYMGIKWVTAKPDEQAKLKQQSIGLLVSAIVVIGATTIWTIALQILSYL